MLARVLFSSHVHSPDVMRKSAPTLVTSSRKTHLLRERSQNVDLGVSYDNPSDYPRAVFASWRRWLLWISRATVNMAEARDEFSKPNGRAPRLLSDRNRKMAVSAHAYVRGSAVRFYQWLEDSNRAALPEGPSAWICGDCHVGNLGPLAAINGGLAVQIRDLDQTVIGNPVHDLIRLALSLAMAARGSDLPGITTAHIIERMVDGYEQAFAPEAEGQTHDSAEPVTPQRKRRIGAPLPS